MARRLLMWCALPLVAACTRVVDGAAFSDGTPPRTGGDVGVDVTEVLLDQSRMRAITGGGQDLTIIPSMDSTSPVDIDALAATAPRQCRFIYAETAVFGPDVEDFHKTTFQDPPKAALISEGAAAYRDAGTAHRALDALAGAVARCADTSAGRLLVGRWHADDASLRMRTGGCGRDYRVRSVVLIEVTFCGFAESVSELVLTNIAANIPG